MDKLRALEVFVRVVDLGSFAAASRDLGISPAMTGNHIRALETWLGIPLILRTTRQHSLTEEGKAVAAEARRVISGMTSLEDLAQDDKNLKGPVTVSAPIALGRRFVAPALQNFLRQYADINVELRLSDQPEDIIKAGLDLAIRNGPLDGAQGSIFARRVGRQRLILVAGRDYTAEFGVPAEINQLERHRCIAYCRNSRPRPWHLPKDDEIRRFDPKPHFMADDVETLRDAALAGLGIAWLPEWLVSSDLQSGKLEQILENLTPYSVDTYILRPNNVPTRRVRLAADFLAVAIRDKLK